MTGSHNGCARSYRVLGLRAAVTLLALASVVAIAAPAVAAEQPAVAGTARPVMVAISSFPTPTVSTIGFSARGRAITMETFGSGPRHVLVLGGVHGSEYGVPVASSYLVWLRAHLDAVPAGTQIDVVTCLNPDGRAKGQKLNARGVDLNRNFPASNWRKQTNSGRRAGSEPETQAMMRLLASRRYVRIISLHSKGGVVDYDGPGGYTLARRIAKAAKMPVVHLASYQVFRGSMGSYVPQRYRTPIITWELASRTMSSRILAGINAGIRP